MKAALKVTALAVLLSSSVALAQVKLRYAHVGVANAPQTLYADEVAKLVKERTNGRIEIQVFANSQLGGVGEMVDGVKLGRDRDRPPRLRLARPDRARHGGVQHAVHVPRRRTTRCAPPTRSFRRRCARSTRSWCEKGNMRIVASLFQGTRELTSKEKVLSREGHAGQEVPRRADQALVVDAHRHGRGRHARRGVGARHRARDRPGGRPGESAAEHLQPQAVRGAEVRDDDRPHAVDAVGVHQRERLPEHARRRPQDHGGHDGRGRAGRRSTGTARPRPSTARTSRRRA